MCTLFLQGNPLWSANALFQRPDLVVDIHKRQEMVFLSFDFVSSFHIKFRVRVSNTEIRIFRFILAGCDVILTNSYHANIRRMISLKSLSKEAATNYLKVDLQNKIFC